MSTFSCSTTPFCTVVRYTAQGHPEFPVNPKISENLKVLAVVVSLDRTIELDAVGARTEFRGL